MDLPPPHFFERIDHSDFAALVGLPVCDPASTASVGAASSMTASEIIKREGDVDVVEDAAPVSSKSKSKSAGNMMHGAPSAKSATKHTSSSLLSKGNLADFYAMGTVLGKGSFGEVHKARRLADGKS